VQTENKLKRCVKHIKDKRISYLYPSPPTRKVAKDVPKWWIMVVGIEKEDKILLWQITEI
jgi:hypothetical protein